MKKRFFFFVIIAAVCFVFSCNQVSSKNRSSINDKAIGKNALAAGSTLHTVQPGVSLRVLQSGWRDKKKSCCVGAPSRFKATAHLAKSEAQ